jgi:hypothetical protein
VEWLKVKALGSSPSTIKKKKKADFSDRALTILFSKKGIFRDSQEKWIRLLSGEIHKHPKAKVTETIH